MGKGTPSDNYPAMPGMVGRQGTDRFIFVKCFVHRKTCWARDDHRQLPQAWGPCHGHTQLALVAHCTCSAEALLLLTEESKTQKGWLAYPAVAAQTPTNILTKTSTPSGSAEGTPRLCSGGC